MSRFIQIRLYESAAFRYNLPVEKLSSGQVPPPEAFPSEEGRPGMDVRGVGSSLGPVPVRTGGISQAAKPQAGGKPVSPTDELEISATGKMLDQLSQNPDVRQERIAAIKAAIANGTYDTDAKLEAALAKMFDSLGLDLDSE
jgi:flagellar biosynthesis anti-sigma factor FlgM